MKNIKHFYHSLKPVVPFFHDSVKKMYFYVLVKCFLPGFFDLQTPFLAHSLAPFSYFLFSPSLPAPITVEGSDR